MDTSSRQCQRKRPQRGGTCWGHLHQMLSAALASGRTYHVTRVTW